MKDNIMDAVTDEIGKRVLGVTTLLRKQYKNTKPYRKEPMSRPEQEFIYRNLSPRQINDGLQKQTLFYEQHQAEILQQSPELAEQMKSPEEMAREDMNAFMFEQYQAFDMGKRRQDNG